MKIENPTGETWVLWDGDCGFCQRSVAWLRERLDDPEAHRFVPYQQATAPPMNEALRARCPRAVQVILPDGEVRQGGDACRLLLRRSRWAAAGRALSAPPLSWLLEPGYQLVARNRMLFSRFLFRDRGRDARGDDQKQDREG